MVAVAQSGQSAGLWSRSSSVQIRSATPRERADVGGSGLPVKQVRNAEGGSNPSAPTPCPRSSAERAPGSEPGGRWFDPSRGHAWSNARVVRERSAKPSTPVRVRLRPPHHPLWSCAGGSAPSRDSYPWHARIDTGTSDPHCPARCRSGSQAGPASSSPRCWNRRGVRHPLRFSAA